MKDTNLEAVKAWLIGHGVKFSTHGKVEELMELVAEFLAVKEDTEVEEHTRILNGAKKILFDLEVRREEIERQERIDNGEEETDMSNDALGNC